MKKLEFYHAEWCGPCRIMKPVLTELKDAGMSIRMYDIEEDSKKAREMGIMGVPTMIIYNGTEELTRLMGVQSKENIAYYMS